MMGCCCTKNRVQIEDGSTIPLKSSKSNTLKKDAVPFVPSKEDLEGAKIASIRNRT